MTGSTVARLAWYSFAAVLLAAAPAKVASWADTRRPVSRDQLCVTEGSVTAKPGGPLTVDGSKMRAVVLGTTGQSAEEARFTYLGPTVETSALGSGVVRRQFGLKLRAQDPCNLVYAMWRFKPKPEIVVQIKSNPGQHESSVCHNHGYITVRPGLVAPVEAPAWGAEHRLAASIRGQSLQVQVDGATAWQGDIGATPLAGTRGPVGIRSDNVRLALTLLAPLADTGPSNCPTGGSED